MNIIVIQSDGSFYTRPDSTLKRRPEDFYLPDDISYATARTCTFITLIKAGKAISPAFAHRYFDTLGCGILFTCEGGITHIDGSSYFFPGGTPASEIDEELSCRIKAELARVTRHISVRASDIIAFENDDPATFRRGDAVNLYPSSETNLEFNIR